MTCSELNERIVDHLYGELGPEEQAAFETHLAGCPACQREVASLGKARQVGRAAVRGALAEAPPARIRAAILNAASAAVTERAAPDVAKPTADGSQADVGWLDGIVAWLRRPWFLPAMVAAGAFAIFFVTRKTITDPGLLPAAHDAKVVQQVKIAKGAPASAPTFAEPAEVAAAGAAKDKTASETGSERRRASARPAATRAGKSLDDQLGAPEGGGARLARSAGSASSDRSESEGFSGFGAGRADVAQRLAEGPAPSPSKPAKRSFALPPPRNQAAGGSLPSAKGEATASAELEAPAASVAPRPAPQEERAGPPAAAPAAPSAARRAPREDQAPPPSAAPMARDELKKGADKAAAEEEGSNESQRARNAAPSVDELERRAERALAEGRYTAAAADLRELLRREPKHARAARWRQRLEAALRAMDPRQ